MNQKSSGKMRPRREVLRRRRRERQIMVFGVATIALAFVTFAAMTIYQGEAEGPFSQPFVTPVSEFASDVRLACPPTNTFPVDSGLVGVRVMNATERAGLAGAVSSSLEGRGFVMLGAGNWPRAYDGTVRVMFGEAGIVQAYTVALHFSGAELVLDNRENSTVDVVLGEFYEESSIRPLLAPELNPDLPLTANAQCLPVHLVPAEPAPRNVPADPFASPEPTSSPDVGDENGESGESGESGEAQD